MPDLPGHERREKRRAKRHGRRIVGSGDEFTSDELDAGTVELEEREPDDYLEGEQYEPWAIDDSKDRSERDRDRLRLYQEFIESRRGEDPDYGNDS
jgi:hypothetical protein